MSGEMRRGKRELGRISMKKRDENEKRKGKIGVNTRRRRKKGEREPIKEEKKKYEKKEEGMGEGG